LVTGFPQRRPGFEPRSGHEGFVVDKVALGQVFFEYFSFPCQFSYHRLLHTHYLSSGAGTIGQLVADVPSGLSLTQLQDAKNATLSRGFSAPCSQMGAFMCFIRISQEKRVVLLNSMNRFTFVIEIQCVFCHMEAKSPDVVWINIRLQSVRGKHKSDAYVFCVQKYNIPIPARQLRFD
jgi:hypothetical protein